MKRIIALLMIFAMLLSLCACGGGKAADDAVDATSAATEEGGDKAAAEADKETDTLEVDENLFNVEVKLPASFFDGESAEEIIAAAEEQGIKKCVVNEDGSVSYTMSKDKHRELLDGLRSDAEESIASFLEGESAVASFVDIVYNDNFSEFNITVNDQYSTWDMFSGFAFYIVGAYYQVFDGANPDEVDVIVNFIDEAGELKDTMSYREFMDSENEAAEEESAG